MEKIRIKGKAGAILTKQVDYLIDKLDDKGRQSTIAVKGDKVYKVVERDFYGAIFGLSKG